MAGMSTSLTVFSTSENSRTYVVSGHTPSAPRVVTQKRRVPSGSQVVADDTVTIVYGTVDADDIPLAQKVSFAASVRRPITGDAADVTAALAVFRDIVASDEFGAMVTGQLNLKN